MCNLSGTAELLLNDAKQGAGNSLGKLLEFYSNYLKLLATTQLDENLRNRVSPSDVVQETLFEAHRDFAQFRGNSAPEFIGWLRRILVNNLGRVVERHILAAKRDVRREVSLQKMNHSLERSRQRLENILVQPGASPASQVELQERVMQLANVLSELPNDYRDVVIFRNLEGLEFKEVAARMDRSSGAVRMLWLRAIDEVRKRLSDKGWL